MENLWGIRSVVPSYPFGQSFCGARVDVPFIRIGTADTVTVVKIVVDFNGDVLAGVFLADTVDVVASVVGARPPVGGVVQAVACHPWSAVGLRHNIW